MFCVGCSASEVHLVLSLAKRSECSTDAEHSTEKNIETFLRKAPGTYGLN